MLQHTEFDIIIIGAGACGLLAARQLAAAGKNVCVLEAEASPGGRVCSRLVAGFDYALETGAEFIHGHLPVTLGLLKEAGIPAIKLQGMMAYNKNGKWQEDETDSAAFANMLRKMQQLHTDIPFDAFLSAHFDDENFIQEMKMYARGFDLADTSVASTFALRDEWLLDDKEIYRVQGGYINLIHHLERSAGNAGVQIFYSTAVSLLQWKAGCVTLFTKNGQAFTARQCLVTAALPVLQALNESESQLRLEPPASHVKNAAAEIGFGSVIKIFMQFSKPFWEEIKPGVAFIISNQVISTWWTQAPTESAVLTGWLGGPGAVKLHHAGDDIILRLATESLSSIFSLSHSALQSMLCSFHLADWLDEMAHGAYSYGKLGSPQARIQLQQPIENTIFFAGEAIYESKHPGTVEAAFEAALKVSDRMTRNNATE